METPISIARSTHLQRYLELVELYKGRNMHEKALLVLKEQGSNPEEGNRLRGTAHVVKYLKVSASHHAKWK